MLISLSQNNNATTQSPPAPPNPVSNWFMEEHLNQFWLGRHEGKTDERILGKGGNTVPPFSLHSHLISRIRGSYVESYTLTMAEQKEGKNPLVIFKAFYVKTFQSIHFAFH